jgi:Arm domain-containing DNA-binding protein
VPFDTVPSLMRNHRHVLAAKAIDGRRTRYTIEGVPGLWLDIKPRGGRAWYVRYQLTTNGTRIWRYYRIGDASAVGLAEAVERARQVRASVDLQGVDPFAAERADKGKATTFDDLFEDWYKRHALPRLALPRDDRLKYDNHLRRPFGARAVGAIKRTDLAALRDTIAANSGPVISNHIVALFNRVMNWAVEEGLIASNPGSRLRKIGEERPRERVLGEDEIRRFWRALSVMDGMSGEHMARGEPGRMLSPATRTVLRLMLLTG